MVDEVRYDCRYLKFINNRRLVCGKDRKLSLTKDGGVSIESILKGITPQGCKRCSLYIKGELLFT